MGLKNEDNTKVLPSLDFALDFAVPCGHVGHNRMTAFHKGNAEYVAVVIHDCIERPGIKGEQYPCCAPWADKVNTSHDQYWTCPVCKDTMLGSEMVSIVGKL